MSPWWVKCWLVELNLREMASAQFLGAPYSTAALSGTCREMVRCWLASRGNRSALLPDDIDPMCRIAKVAQKSFRIQLKRSFWSCRYACKSLVDSTWVNDQHVYYRPRRKPIITKLLQMPIFAVRPRRGLAPSNSLMMRRLPRESSIRYIFVLIDFNLQLRSPPHQRPARLGKTAPMLMMTKLDLDASTEE